MERRLGAEQGGDRGPSVVALHAQDDVERDFSIAQSLGLTLAQFDALDPVERAGWIHRWQTKQGRCQQCRRPIRECSDHNRLWWVVRQVCVPTMRLQGTRALFDQLHKDKPYHDGSWQRWSKERTEKYAYRYDDGTDLIVVDRDLIPDDDFFRDKTARPLGVDPIEDADTAADDPDDPRVDSDGDEPEQD